MKKCLLLLSFIGFMYEPSVCLEKEDFYIGLEGQTRHMEYKKGFGDLIARKNHFQSNIYVGYHINENFALEIGREKTTRKVKHATVRAGQAVNGVPIPGLIGPAIFKTIVKIRGPHIDLVFSKPFSESSKFNMVGSLGLSSLMIVCERELVSAGNMPMNRTRHMRKNSVALRAMGGLQYAFNNDISVRFSLNFVNTGKMVVRMKGPEAKKLEVVPRILPKDTLAFGVGILIPF